MKTEDLDMINNEMDSMLHDISQIAHKKIEDPVVLISRAENLSDSFRVHLHHRKNPKDSDSILLDEETLDNLKQFNENAVLLLESFRKLKSKEVCEILSDKLKSLDEFKSYVLHQKEVQKNEFIKLQMLKDNLDALIKFLHDENVEKTHNDSSRSLD